MQHNVHHTRRDRISAVSSQVHTAATTLRDNLADLKNVDPDDVTKEQADSLLHAAIRAATHARSMLDDARALAEIKGKNL